MRPLPDKLRESLKEKILSRSIPEPNSGCWIWIASTPPSGYGDIRINSTDLWLAHRLSYALFKGDIPEGLHVLHSCDNRACVNPDHLTVGTNLDNIKDSMLKGRRKGITRNRPSGLVYKHNKYPDSVRCLAKEFLSNGETRANVARKCNLPWNVVDRLCRNEL